MSETLENIDNKIKILEKDIVNDVRRNYEDVKERIYKICNHLEEIKEYNEKTINEFYETFIEK